MRVKCFLACGLPMAALLAPLAKGQSLPNEASNNAGSTTSQNSEIVVTAKAGSLYDQDIFKTAKTVVAIDSALIDDVQAASIQDVTKLLPALTPRTESNQFQSRFYVRGLDLADIYTRDGLYLRDAFIAPETIERIELLEGIPNISEGGFSLPGGEVNFVPKVPKIGSFADLKMAGDSLGGFQASVDANLWSRDSKVGIRVIAADREDGFEYAGASGHRRSVALGAAYLITPDIRLDLNGTYDRGVTNGYDALGYPLINNGTALPALSYNHWYGQSWANQTLTRYLGEAKLTGSFDDGWAFTIKGNAFHYDVTEVYPYYRSAGAGSLIGVNFYNIINNYKSVSLFGVASKTHTFGVAKNTLAVTADYTNVPQTFSSAFARLGTEDLYGSSLQVPPPPGVSAAPPHPDSREEQHSFGIGDELTLWDKLTLSGSARRYYLKELSFEQTPTTEDYLAVWLPSASIMYRFTPKFNIYFTYGKSAEDGGQAGVGTVNYNQLLGPIKSTSYEVGTKAAVLGGLATLSAFKIERPSEAVVNNYDTLSGNTNYKGIDFSLQGTIAHRLTLLVDAEYVDAKVTRAEDPTLIGTTPTNVPKFSASVRADYEVTDGLFASANVQHIARKPVSDDDSLYAPGYTLLDLGLRYGIPVYGHKVELLLTASNVTNKFYYVSTKFSFVHLGDPRTVRGGVDIHF